MFFLSNVIVGVSISQRFQKSCTPPPQKERCGAASLSYKRREGSSPERATKTQC
jgi:hypothetical protein